MQVLKALKDQRPTPEAAEVEYLLQESLEKEYLTTAWKRSAAQAAIKARRLEEKLLEVLGDKKLLNSELRRMLEFLHKEPFESLLREEEKEN